MAGMKISVIIDEQGGASVEGPLQNKVLCYGLLHVGFDIVRDHKAGPVVRPVVGAAAGAVLSLVHNPQDAA